MTQTEPKTLVGAERGLRAAKVPSQPTIGRWRLCSRAAEGAWTRVYRARPVGMGDDGPALYALKVLRPERRGDPAAAALLVREARAARSVRHPHVVSVLESQIRREPLYLVMPWLEGATLEARLSARPWIDLPETLWIVRQACEGLDALYAAGWLHGDVKPSNIFVSPERHVTLLDLGFTRRLDERDDLAERSLMGTGHYLAPEYFTASRGPDIRSDIYSLGVVLYRMLSGRLPLDAEDLGELARQHKQTAPPNLRRLAPHVPPEISRLVHELLAKDPLRRPQTPRELIDRLMWLEIATFAERAAG